ncbi:tryptophan 7-halogenase [Pseudomaricurvus alkylphenolicus]|uniref:tryptophan halogenase family protein n=1 Tax=Pseudomaricurvus alkylphenolicus TaxID=1306991 RepID=UPI00141DA830|nr:tryptophan halogenase family protein [Pseudomaricurvus alkylphenolicus]NIB44198.1 tryptophan 7-halogenase [Pseudomaricurvus alkylphenolicus]
MTNPVNHIVIVGGGTAGWLTAGLIASKNQPLDASDLKITLIESPDIPTIGVGEGTWPSMRRTLREIGIRETDLIRDCHAAFKQGSQFINWCSDNRQEHYFHPFNPPITTSDPFEFWQRQSGSTQSFADCLDAQPTLCEAGLAPKTITTAEYAGTLNYGYHLDAGAFSTLLQKHCCNALGVRHHLQNVQSVHRAENGDISHLITADGQTLQGDLFIDCTGFRGLLIGESLQVPLIPQGHILFADRALAGQVTYDQPDQIIACQTRSTAQSAGWIWDIGLSHRRGIGYVYSSNHISDEAAERELANYIGPGFGNTSVRRININSGYRKKFWVNNCIAIGLSAGFLEPLEASALMLIEQSANMIAERLPANRMVMDRLAEQFNQRQHHHWERIVEFLKLHYVLSNRQAPFWQENREVSSIPESLSEKLQLWEYHAPTAQDFSAESDVFSWISYQYILYGMGFKTEARPTCAADRCAKLSQLRDRRLEQLLTQLPNHRQLVDKIRQYGLQTV